ncbi:MAG: HAD family hydrolase [Bryobacteraceae bacterium]|jgi:putative hydrolase of the HAD superfamily
MNPLCVVFDIDDTLYLERDYVLSGFAALGPWARDWLGLPDFADRCRRAHEDGRRGRVFNTVLEECGVPPAPAAISALVALYRSHVPAIQLCEDAAAALEHASARWPVAVISDGPAISQSRKAEALALSRFASPICLTELLGPECSKPSPVVFREVERALAARRYVYVADNPLKDFTAPATLGWKTIRIRRPAGLYSALDNGAAAVDFELSDCTKLPELLSSL